MALIRLVYYVYIRPEVKYLDIIRGQLLDIKYSQILAASHLYLIISGPRLCVNKTMDLFHQMFHTEIESDHITIQETNENQYEYPGIMKIYELGQLYPDSLLIYMHTKGMSYDIQSERHSLNIVLTRHTLWHWSQTVEIFNHYPQIKKIGLFPGETGVMFFNFFWIRGSYVKTCPYPTVSTDRYDYERWLEKSTEKIPHDSYNLYTHDQTVLSYFQVFPKVDKIIINHVFYGLDDKRIDITNQFINQWSQNIMVTVSNQLAGHDPIYGRKKKLTIIFHDGREKEYNEGDSINTISLIMEQMTSK